MLLHLIIKTENGEDTTSTLTLEYGTNLKDESDKISTHHITETPNQDIHSMVGILK